MGMGTKSWEWEGMGTRKLFPHISNHASHASHCWQHACVIGYTARQCTCAPRSWNSQAPTPDFYLSRSVAAKQSGPKPGWLPNMNTDAGTCVQDTASRHQRLETVAHWSHNWQACKHITKRHRWSCWSVEKAITCMRVGKRTPLWVRTSAKLKPELFRATILHNRLFSEPSTV